MDCTSLLIIMKTEIANGQFGSNFGSIWSLLQTKLGTAMTAAFCMLLKSPLSVVLKYQAQLMASFSCRQAL